jgi:formate-dependent nitrite reductase membrane component NrfD
MKIRPYEWMVKYTAQSEWIERRGILMWLAEVASGLGAGLYLVSLFFNNLLGMLLGWLIVIILKGGFHLAYLGKPLRFWRIVSKPGTSWMSRGFIFMVLFIGLGAIQMALSYWMPGTGLEVIFKVLTGITAFLLAVYTGFVMNYVNGVPFWNSALLPLLFILGGVLDGSGLIIAIGLFGGDVDIMAAETVSRVLLITTAVVIGVYLWSATYMGAAGKQAEVELVRGHIAPILWAGVVFLGIIVPIVISISSYFTGEVSAGLLLVGIAGETIGAFSLKYCILKAGIYSPLIPANIY